MQALELLAPARNKDIGIAAIDCGADAVYMAGPDFGARKAAGNSFEDIAELCSHAHRFGARVFVTFNTLIRPEERDEAHRQMLLAQQAGADAFIIRDPSITLWKDITIPLHASTQCAIRDVARARQFAEAGCARIILERELDLGTVKQICAAVDCEVEFFVHGALCVCYSGDCRLSEYIDGRSADRGECIQACRSLYDLVDENGRTILRNKAILSLKDYNLRGRLCDLAEAGVSSFKIEGRLKNASYVRNVVRDYSLALDSLVASNPERWCRASYGKVCGGFTPDTAKTFNRGYTELYLDGKRGRWSSMDAPKSMGEAIGSIGRILSRESGRSLTFRVKPASRELKLNNGDGFAFVTADGITGFRGDVCNGLDVSCKDIPELREGLQLYRNVNSAFEKTLDTQPCKRELEVSLRLRIHGKYVIEVSAFSEDGREICSTFNTDVETAQNSERAEAMLREQLGKRSLHYHFRMDGLDLQTAGGKLPLLSASTINSIRRLVAEDLDALPCSKVGLFTGAPERKAPDPDLVISGQEGELMRTRYCVRYELGMCPRLQGGKPPRQLYIINNGRKLALNFDCAACEMTVTPAQK